VLTALSQVVSKSFLFPDWLGAFLRTDKMTGGSKIDIGTLEGRVHEEVSPILPNNVSDGVYTFSFSFFFQSHQEI
jgi:hypothetical protein